jgi:DNA helicase-2/ATP-dependent DNA helicase PcrA
MVMSESLNTQQKKAVELIGSPLLIFAGAGSGKTRVLTEKIAHLIEKVGMPPEHILSVTFTNKAASEMKQRVQRLITHDVSRMTIGTFHSVCAGLLRKHIHLIGYDNNFTIYDQSDSKQLVKSVINGLNLDPKTFQANKYQYLISSLKNKMIPPDDVLLNTDSYIDEVLRDIYLDYNKKLKENNAADFDDLLLLPLEIFKKNPSLLKHYQDKFQYVLVDEYQDTNKPQFEFIYSVSRNNNEITVVGDDDQSIYGWRGADISNILNFSKSFKNSQTIKLEQNYRSTKIILDAAYHVVSKNKNRADKKLWTDNLQGDLIYLYEFDNETDESKGVIRNILSAARNEKLNDMVILYRTNTQSRVIEDQLRRESIPYHIVGGIKFYDRKEIKDILAYLKYILNPSDTIAFTRVVNFPPRGIGKTTVDKIFRYTNDQQISLSEGLNRIDEIQLGDKQKKQLKKFNTLIRTLQQYIDKPTLDIVERLIDDINLKDHYKSKDNPEDLERLANVDELVLSISDFCDRNEENNLALFIEEVSLLTDIDRWNVYILGLEEGLLPLMHNNDDDDIEEERRLFYVGITRGIKRVIMSYANSRRRYGSSSMFNLRSSFLDDIPESTFNFHGKKRSVFSSKTSILQEKSNEGEFAVNDIVEHKLYGQGRIIFIKGIGDSSKISIKFRGNETKKFIKKYANLKKIT